MGFCQSMMGSEFFLAREHHKEALAAIRKLFTAGDQRWVKVRDMEAWTTISDAFTDYGYHPTLDEDYNIVGLSFESEKQGAEPSPSG